MTIRIIQLAAEQVTLARFAVRRGELAFLGSRRLPRPDDVELSALLRELAEPPANDERVVLALAPEQVAVRQVMLPLTDRRKVRDILPLELKGELAQDTAELVFDALPSTAGTWIACWLPVAGLTPLLAAARGAASEAEIATYGPACWGELIPAPERELTVALSDGTGCAVFAAGVPVYFRSFAGEAAAELQRTLTALELGQGLAIDRCYLFGAVADVTPQGEAFPSQCALLPTDGFLAATFASDPQAARDLAGLAAMARATATAEPVNFRQGTLAYTAGRERLRKSLRLPAILAICVVLALFAELGVRWQLLRKDVASLDKSIGMIYREVFPKRKPVDEAAEIRAEIRRLAGSGGESSVLATLKILAEALNDGVGGFSEVELDGTTVRLRGEAKSLQAVNDLKSRLATQLTGLELVESRSKGTSGEVAFVLRASGVKGGAQ